MTQTILDILKDLRFSASAFPCFIGGGFKQEGQYEEGEVLSGARKRVYRNFGAIFGASGSTNNFLDLFISGHITETQTMNLFIEGGYHDISSTIPLFCCNEFLSGNTLLFISGLGGEAGYKPHNESLNLYIQRNSTHSLPCYIYGGPQPSASAELLMYLLGGSVAFNDLPLSIRYVSEVKTSTMPMYSHGF